MKKNYLFIILFIFSLRLSAQIGFGTNNPNPSSVLDLVSSNRGILFPRVSLTNISDVNTINTPSNGLTVYNLSNTGGLATGFYYFNSLTSKWVKFGIRSWKLNGNSDINSAIDFLGTAEDRDFIIKRNNVQSGLINQSLQNTSFGVGALMPLTTGTNNVAFGYQSLNNNTTGSYNVGVGSQALFSNTTGSNNVANGYQALYNNLTGNDNVAVGSQASYSNTTANNNIAVGYQSLKNNTIGSDNVAIGYQSLQSNVSGSSNVALGFSSLYNLTQGTNNVAVGSSSQYNNIQGNDNVSVGSSSLYTNTGTGNVAVGNETIYIKAAGNYNTAFGYQALYNLTSGNNNTAYGANAGKNLVSGNNNTAFGANTNFASTTSNDQLNITNVIFGTGLNGSSSAPAGNIGILTASPNSTLQVEGSIATNIRSGSGTIKEIDYTVLINGNAQLPIPYISNQGRIYYLINSTVNSYTISTTSGTGYFRDNGVTLNNFVLNNSDGSRGIKVQSTGSQWVIIAKY